MTIQNNGDNDTSDWTTRERIGHFIIMLGLNYISRFGAWVAGWETEVRTLKKDEIEEISFKGEK